MSNNSVFDLFSCKDLVVVVTGGGSGIGWMMTKALVDAGARRVYILGRRQEVLDEAAAYNKDVTTGIQCDITKKPDLATVVDRIKTEAGYINVLINNAGIAGPKHMPVLEMTSLEEIQTHFWKDETEDWLKVFETNVSAVYFTSVAFLGLLDEGNKKTTGLQSNYRSQIVTVTSIASFNRRITSGLPYHTSKAAATHMGKMLATLLAPFKIRSNVIAPGIYPSDMTDHNQDMEYPWHQIPHNSKGHPDDMAGAVLYLVSGAGKYLNGTVNITDGGRLSVVPATF